MLAILDYKAGNQTSVRRALEYMHIPCRIAATAEETAGARGLIFPGVGAARQAMDHLRGTGMDKVLANAVAAKLPILGICVGCQILLDYSEENDNTPTLGYIPGITRAFDPAWTDNNDPIRIPHMGWNNVEADRGHTLFRGIDPDAQFYFVHGYYPVPAEEYIIGRTNYGVNFCSVFGRPGLWAVQFHVEKSGRPGLALLKNFYEYCLENRPEDAAHA